MTDLSNPRGLDGPDRILGYPEATRLVGVSRDTLQREAKSGQLRIMRLMLGLMAAFAAPCLRLAKQEGGGFQTPPPRASPWRAPRRSRSPVRQGAR